MQESLDETIPMDNVTPVDIIPERDENIKWTDFEGRWVKFEDGQTRELVVANPGSVKKEFKSGITTQIEFDVLELDGEKQELGDKVWDVSSNKLIMRLRPIIEKMQASNKPVKLKVTRVGIGVDTNYAVKEI